MKTKVLPDFWQQYDPRIEGLLDLAHATLDAFELSHGEAYDNPDHEMWQEHRKYPELYPIWTPLELGKGMEQAAERIKTLTSTESVVTPFYKKL